MPTFVDLLSQEDSKNIHFLRMFFTVDLHLFIKSNKLNMWLSYIQTTM